MWPEPATVTRPISPRTRTRSNACSTVRFTAWAISPTVNSGRLSAGALAGLAVSDMAP
jgi:hypothetical protein